MQEQLQNEIQQSPSENEAFMKVFGKEHPGYVRGLGLGVTPSQIGCTSRFTSLASSLHANAKMEKMHSEIDALKAQVAEVDALKAQVAEVDALKAQVAEVDILKQQIAFLMQNAKENQVMYLLFK